MEQRKTFSGDRHATWAKQFKIGFNNGGWYAGTIEEVVRGTLLEIPSKQDFRKVEKSYSKLFKGEVLAEKLEAELSHTEFAEMKAIYNGKPETAKEAQQGVPIFDPDGWAVRIHAGVSYEWLGIGWGTDWEAIKRVILEMKEAGGQRAYEATQTAYREKFGDSLTDALKGDLSTSELDWIKRTLNT